MRKEIFSPKNFHTTPHFSNMSYKVLLFLYLIAIFQCYSEILLPSQLHRDLLISSPVNCPAPNPNLYYQPVIGILSHPGDSASGRLSNATSASFIIASYVKFVEAAGARVIPLIYNEPTDKLLKVFIAIINVK